VSQNNTNNNNNKSLSHSKHSKMGKTETAAQHHQVRVVANPPLSSPIPNLKLPTLLQKIHTPHTLESRTEKTTTATPLICVE